MSEVAELKRVQIDELELYLEILKADHPESIHNATFKQIANLIQNNFGVVCTEQDMFLLHEPTIDEDRISIEIYYKALGII